VYKYKYCYCPFTRPTTHRVVYILWRNRNLLVYFLGRSIFFQCTAKHFLAFLSCQKRTLACCWVKLGIWFEKQIVRKVILNKIEFIKSYANYVCHIYNACINAWIFLLLRNVHDLFLSCLIITDKLIGNFFL